MALARGSQHLQIPANLQLQYHTYNPQLGPELYSSQSITVKFTELLKDPACKDTASATGRELEVSCPALERCMSAPATNCLAIYAPVWLIWGIVPAQSAACCPR